MASLIEKDLGVPVVCENKPGASGALAFSYVTRRPPDGYTLAHAPVEIAIVRALGYADIGPEDMGLICLVSKTPAVLVVRSDAPWNTFEEFMAAAKKQSGGLIMGNAGTGSIWHFNSLLMEQQAGFRVTYVPYGRLVRIDRFAARRPCRRRSRGHRRGRRQRAGRQSEGAGCIRRITIGPVPRRSDQLRTRLRIRRAGLERIFHPGRRIRRNSCGVWKRPSAWRLRARSGPSCARNEAWKPCFSTATTSANSLSNKPSFSLLKYRVCSRWIADDGINNERNNTAQPHRSRFPGGGDFLSRPGTLSDYQFLVAARRIGQPARRRFLSPGHRHRHRFCWR